MWRIIAGGLFGMTVAWLPHSQAEVIRIPDIVDWYTREASVPIALESKDGGVLSLATKAFETHGYYRLAPADEAQYILSLERLGADAVEVRIRPGSSDRDQDQVRRRVTVDECWKEAVLRACDFAVTQTSGLPGYFAGKLAFVGERKGNKEIFTSDLFFQKVQQVTSDGADSLLPRWSPDGRQLLYTGYFKSGFPDIFLLDVWTGQRRSFAAYKGTNTGACFDPSGSRVAMILSPNGNPELYIADANGGSLKRLARTRGIESSPSWAPDGQRLVVTSDGIGKPQLYEITVDGGRLQRLPTDISGYCAEPVWNPLYPNLIAFTAAEGRRFQVALYDAQQRKSRFLTQCPEDCLEPRWIHDGRHLLYTQRTGKSKQLFIIDTETGKATPLHSTSFGPASQCDFVYIP